MNTQRLAGLAMAMVVSGTALEKPVAAQDDTGKDRFTAAVKIGRPVEDVWAAIVTKAIVDTYYFVPLSADLNGAGQAFHYGPGDEKMIVGEVLEYQPPDMLKHSFRFGGPDQPVSVVTYSLKGGGGQTEVVVIHEGYASDSQPYADIAGGWPIILEGMKARLEAK